MHFKRDLQDRVRLVAGTIAPVIFGLDNGMVEKHRGKDYFYLDHAYFKRGWHNGVYRLVRGAPHLTRVIPHEEDRLARYGVVLKDYRTNGSHIVVMRPGVWMAKIYKAEGLMDEMIAEVKKYTDRKIIVKTKGSPMDEALRDAWAVVSPFSVAGVDAAVAGYPVYSTHMCPSWPISGQLKDIESPTLPDRYAWANSLAWSTWHTDDIKTIDYRNYQCAS